MSPWELYTLLLYCTYLVAQTVKRLSTMWETWVRSLGREIPWRRKWQPTPVLLPRKSHGRRSLVSMGSQRVGHDRATSLYNLMWTPKWSEVKVKVAQLCLTLCDPMNYSVHGILQASILQWVAVPISRGSSQPRDRTQVSCVTGGFFTVWATREALWIRKTHTQ